jgi:hypothetical protein
MLRKGSWTTIYVKFPESLNRNTPIDATSKELSFWFFQQMLFRHITDGKAFWSVLNQNQRKHFYERCVRAFTKEVLTFMVDAQAPFLRAP